MGGDGQVRIQLKNSPSECRLTFTDEGPGIPEDIRQRVFEPFFTTKNRGTGLGLAIARRAVELHDGSLEFECPATGGTVVTMRLPRRQVPPRGTEAQGA
jgi:signal transduction histidine kinase